MTARLTRIALLVLALGLLGAAPALGAKDSDKDGLPDKWEKGTAPGGLNLKKLGADPKYRDIFVEIDFAKGMSYNKGTLCSELGDLVKAFKKAPLKNPNGKNGIKLHLDAGLKCGKKKYDKGGSSKFKIKYDVANFGDISNTMNAKRLRVFRHAGVVPGNKLGAEGIANETDFLLKINGGGGFAHVFMHELGHTLRLDHGGITHYSAMSGPIYSFPAPSRILDYHRYPVDALDESALSEQDGIQSNAAGENYFNGIYVKQLCPDDLGFAFVASGRAGSNVDWDCDGFPFWMPPHSNYIDEGPVSADINGDGQIGIIPAVQPEWPRLKLGNGRIG